MIIKMILLSIVALLHIYFLVLEMFLWTKPLVLKTFNMTEAEALDKAVLAGNQGLYNGFLAAGIIWAMLHPNPLFSQQISIFFLSCVIIAALYGGYTVSSRILMIQGSPAVIAMIFLLFFQKK